MISKACLRKIRKSQANYLRLLRRISDTLDDILSPINLMFINCQIKKKNLIQNMGCSQMKKKKQFPLKNQYGNTDSLNAQHQVNQVSIQLANSNQMEELDIVQQQTKVPASQELLNEKIPKLLSSYREIREIKKKKYKPETISNLLGEEKECYRLRDDYLLGSFRNASTFTSPLKKQLVQNENKSMKTLKRKTSDNLINIF